MKLLQLFIAFLLACSSLLSFGMDGFVENKGQIIDEFGKPNQLVKYIFETGDLKITLRNNGFSYEKIKNKQSYEEIHKLLKNNKLDFKIDFEGFRVDFIFDDEIENIETAELNSGIHHFYTNNHSINNVQSFKKVIYKNVYNDFDIEFIIDENNTFKYNIITEKPEFLSNFNLKIVGAKSLKIIDGNLEIETPLGKIIETVPESFLKYHGQTKNVKINYKLENNNLQFHTTEKLIGKLIIDPEPEVLWGTYYGGNGLDWILNVATDKNDNIFNTGLTNSFNNISTVGAHEFNYQGDLDGFVAKYNRNGTLLWATYYGGPQTERPYAICTDPSGNVYASGSTFSQINIHTPGALQDYLYGQDDMFIVKFNENGTRIWGTYLGGEAHEFSTHMLHRNGNVYVTGHTTSTLNISTSGTFLPSAGQIEAGFLISISDEGNAQNWGTYIGTGDNSSGEDLAFFGDKIAVVGRTRAENNISTTGTFQDTYYPGSFLQGFLMLFDDTGNLDWGTYYGGNFSTRARGVAVLNNHIYLAGSTNSTIEIATPGAYQTSRIDEHGYLAKFDSLGQRIWGTYVGGNAEDIIENLNVSRDNLIIAGQTRSTQSIASQFAYQANNAGDFDGFYNGFDENGNFLWGSYFGGDGTEYIYKSAVLSNGSIVFVGNTSTLSNGIAVNNANQNTFGGGSVDGMMFQICLTPEISLEIINGQIIASGGQDYEWFYEGTLLPDVGGSLTPTQDGMYSVISTDNGACTSDEVSILFESEDDDDASITDNYDQINFKIYPNPSKEMISIEGETNFNAIHIYDLQGKAVINEFLPHPIQNSTFNINELNPGYYFLIIEHNSGKSYFKIQKE